MTLASVIVPCQNVAPTIGDQLDALARQDLSGEWEVVLVDDGSSDDTVEIARSFAARLPALRIVTNPAPRNVARARNLGVAHARADLLLFCDGDDVVDTSWARHMLQAIEGRTVLAAGRSEVERLNPPWLSSARDAPQQHGLQQWTDPTYLPHAGGGNLAISRWVLDRIGGFTEDDDLRLNEAVELCWRAQLAEVPMVFVPDAIVHVRFRASYRAIFRQARGWAECSVALHRRFAAHGLPPPRWRRGLAGWLRVPVRLLTVRDRGALARWLHLLGWKVGRVGGSLRHRRLAF